jgi:hypothetical protein
LPDIVSDNLTKPLYGIVGRGSYSEKLVGFDVQYPGYTIKHFRTGKLAGKLDHGDILRGKSGFFGQFFL